KEQVQFMVMSMLSIQETPEFFDATDALAVAITHAVRHDTKTPARASSWEQYIRENPQRLVRKS
ncbi:MAG: crossover junction endodeoxyribonuclease RuvC, partial [Candidatus Kapaibacterium sp.]